MNKSKLIVRGIKAATTVIIGIGVNVIINDIVNSTEAPNHTKLKTLCVIAATVAICGIVSKTTNKYVSEEIDNIVRKFDEKLVESENTLNEGKAI